MPRFEDALRLVQELDCNVVPAGERSKHVRIQWKRYQTERVTERFLRDAFAQPGNLFIITGAISRLVVLDCDSERAQKMWQERLGDVMNRTTRVKTARGFQYYFRLAQGQVERGRSGDEWDLRCEGGGVLGAGSVHPSGHVYAYIDGRGPEALQAAPGALWERSEGEEAESRSVLTYLLLHPPRGEGSGRNDWLSKVAGHYGKHLPFYDAYEWHVREAADKLEPSLPEEEIGKLVRSIWNAEQSKLAPADERRERKIADEIDRLVIREEARARIRAEAFTVPSTANTFEEDMHTNDASVTWLVDELFPCGANTLLMAKAKTGKSSLALSLMKALVDNEPFLGCPTKLKGDVAYWNREMHPTMWRQWVRRLEIDHTDRAWVVHLRGEQNPLASEAGIQWTINWLRENRIQVWVLDTYGAHFTGDDPNSEREVRSFVNTLDRIKLESGVQELLLIAHAGHFAERPRGSSVLLDWPDALWSLMSENQLRFLSAEGRDVEFAESTLTFDVTRGEYRLGTYARNRRRSENVGKHEQRRALAVEAAQHRDGVTKRKLAALMEGGGDTSKRLIAIDDAVNRGELAVFDGLYFAAGEEPHAHQQSIEDDKDTKASER